MARITVAEAQAWLEPTKGDLGGDLDSDLLPQIESRILGRVASSYDTSGWTTNVNTPQIIRTCIAMTYVAWAYRKQYSEEGETNQYADLLLASVEATLEGIINGTIVVVEVPVGDSTVGQPTFYPTDISTAQDPLDFPDDTSVGANAFSMNKIF